MHVRELGHIVLYVRDVEKSRHFYGQILGWKEIAEGSSDQVAAFSSGRTHHELLLIEVGSRAAPIPPNPRLGLYHFGLRIGETDDDLREAIETCQREGVRIVGAADHTVTHSLYVTDPDGNEIELYVDTEPALWRDNPEMILAPVRPLRI